MVYINNNTKIKKQSCCLFLLMFLFFIITSYSFAGVTTELNSNSAVKQIGALISLVFNPVAVLSVGCGLLKIVVTNNTKSTEDTLKWIKNIVVAFVIFNTLGVFFNFVDSFNFSNAPTIPENIPNFSEVLEKYNG